MSEIARSLGGTSLQQLGASASFLLDLIFGSEEMETMYSSEKSGSI
jgi:hypothetical protein